MDFDSSFLFASLLWGSVGVGYFIFGKKQGAMIPLIGGLLMIAASYVVSSWLLMSFASIALIIAMHWLMKRGF